MERTTEAQHSVEILNSFLRGEISAVETYQQALAKIDEAELTESLRRCMRSHEKRVDSLERRIAALGGAPSLSSGVWGAFAKLVEGSASVLGKKAALAALEEGEDHGRNDYRRDLDKLDAESKIFVATEILPEQQQTHDVMTKLKHVLH